jgi:hypothetical protein
MITSKNLNNTAAPRYADNEGHGGTSLIDELDNRSEL